MLPWVHLYISPAGKVNPCCISSWEDDVGDVNESSIEEIWNGKKMKKVRSRMLRDLKIKGCWQCYENERLGLRSNRQVSNFCYSHKMDWVESTKGNGYAPESKPIYWDLRITNLCNFKCRICNHHSSSKLYDEAVKLGTTAYPTRVHYSMKDFDRVMGQLNPIIPDIEEIYFAGGEPLIMDEHYHILNLLIDNNKTNVKLRYATNFSTSRFKGRDVFKLWNAFDEVYLHTSLDGSGKRGEYQRKGQVWKDVISERKRLKEVCPHVQFMISPTVSIFNAIHLPDFHREWVDLDFIKVDDLIPNALKNPPEYNIRVLPGMLKKSVEKKYLNHIEWLKSFSPEKYVKLEIVINEYKSVLNYMNAEDQSHLIPDFINKCNQLDEWRNEDTASVFPELAPIFQ